VRLSFGEALVGRTGDHIPRRSLEFYQAVGYTYGIWRSTDHAVTWKYLGIPLPRLIKAVEVDANIYGQVYVAFAGSSL
jgi:hypothetical protein